jgi:hypothetical protein
MSETQTQPGNSGEQQKWVIDYQATDESGNPIGNPTHLEADTQKELIEKMKETNIAIVRAYHKLKTGQQSGPDALKNAEKRKPASEIKPRDWTTEEAFQTTSELQNPSTMRKAVRKAIEDELGAPLDEVRESITRTRKIDQEFVNQAFMAAHREFYPCVANAKAIGKYLWENQLAYTIENLEIAFDYLKDSLIQRPATQPSQQNTEVPPQQGNTSTQRQRSTTAGLNPGETSGNVPRPGQQSKRLTWAEVDKWTDAEWEKAKRDPVLIQQINSLPQRGRR